jgi:hypothetical protein
MIGALVCITSLNRIEGWFEKKPKVRKVYTNTNQKSNEKSSSRSHDDQQRIDEILDKISKSGYEKLSKEEKDFLFKFGKK